MISQVIYTEESKDTPSILPPAVFYVFDLLMLAIENDKAILYEIFSMRSKNNRNIETVLSILYEVCDKAGRALVFGGIIGLVLILSFGPRLWLIIPVVIGFLLAQCVHMNMLERRNLREAILIDQTDI